MESESIDLEELHIEAENRRLSRGDTEDDDGVMDQFYRP